MSDLSISSAQAGSNIFDLQRINRNNENQVNSEDPNSVFNTSLADAGSSSSSTANSAAQGGGGQQDQSSLEKEGKRRLKIQQLLGEIQALEETPAEEKTPEIASQIKQVANKLEELTGTSYTSATSSASSQAMRRKDEEKPEEVAEQEQDNQNNELDQKGEQWQMQQGIDLPRADIAQSDSGKKTAFKAYRKQMQSGAHAMG